MWSLFFIFLCFHFSMSLGSSLDSTYDKDKSGGDVDLCLLLKSVLSIGY